MRSARWLLGTLAVASAELFACSSSTSEGTLAFTIAESLLIVVPEDSTLGSVALSSTTGNCARFQAGVDYTQVASTNFLYFPLAQLDASNNPQPLTGGAYTIIDPNSSFNGPGFIANAIIETTDSACYSTTSPATDGTVTLSLVQTADGGSASVSYAAIFNNTKITGTYGLSTCSVSENVASKPPGTCVAP